MVEPPSGIPADGKKKKKTGGCAIPIPRLLSTNMATGLAKVPEQQQNRAGKTRSNTRVYVFTNPAWYLCFPHAKPDLYR